MPSRDDLEELAGIIVTIAVFAAAISGAWWCIVDLWSR